MKTPRFHVLSGEVDVVGGFDPVISQSYAQFVREFGSAKLYRNSRDGYYITVFSTPKSGPPYKDSKLSHIGSCDGAYVCVAPVKEPAPVPVLEVRATVIKKVAEGFEEWVFQRCSDARSTYGPKKWK